MYGSPHDEIIEIKVQRARKSLTGDNFEPGMDVIRYFFSCNGSTSTVFFEAPAGLTIR